MKMLITICDNCDEQIPGGVFKSASDDGDYCSRQCASAERCQHEENVSDQTNGRDTARLICKACGYDREVAVA